MNEAVVFALIVGAGLAGWFVLNRDRPLRFRARQVVTGTGLEFLFRLKRALPECTVCPQIAATSLLEPLGMGVGRKAALSRIVGRRVGYAVFDAEMKLIVVIELDHRPRLTRREAECDRYFADAGIKTLRFHPKRMPSGEKIRASVFPRGRGERAASPVPDHDGTIDFRPRAGAWRNTVNAHS
jgi:hypothetical protein